MDLFTTDTPDQTPLADRMRPKTFDEVLGQAHLTGPEGILRKSIENQSLGSFILWGPPGTGKTTLSEMVAKQSQLAFFPFSAVMTSMRDVKEIMQKAKNSKAVSQKPTVVFIDEIHRFNKAQQDAFLPYVERKDIILMGATTENPSFEIRSALLSRLQVYTLNALGPDHLLSILKKALASDAWIASKDIAVDPEALDLIATHSQSDARSALTLLEVSLSTASTKKLTRQDVLQVMQKPTLYYDKDGEEHFNIISALHKSMRNSDVQASLYWLGRMIEAGEDPLYIVRRMIRFASEDIGLADVQALTLAISVRDTVAFLGLPEAKLAMAQLAIYLACAPKSNAVYQAYKSVEKDIHQGKIYPVPMHIRNAPTTLMKDLGYAKGYEYAHDQPDKVSRMNCLPKALQNKIYYQPTEKGFEQTLSTWMDHWQSKKEKTPG